MTQKCYIIDGTWGSTMIRCEIFQTKNRNNVKIPSGDITAMYCIDEENSEMCCSKIIVAYNRTVLIPNWLKRKCNIGIDLCNYSTRLYLSWHIHFPGF